MLHRVVATIIIAFWLVMTALLVRDEVAPSASRVRDVPLLYVMKMIYRHEQPSDLTIYNGTSPIGSFRMQPRIETETRRRMLDLSGELRLPIGADQKIRLSWMGVLGMNSAYQPVYSKWSVAMLGAEHMHFAVESPMNGQPSHYTLRSGEHVLAQGDIPNGENGLATMAQQFGMGEALNSVISQARQQTPPTIRARQSSLRVQGEVAETYLVAFEQNGQEICAVHLSQLGQILQATTALGYTLRLDGANF